MGNDKKNAKTADYEDDLKVRIEKLEEKKPTS